MHTEGISITAGKHNYSEIVFMDTAGTDTPVAHNKVGYKRATEALLHEVVVHLPSFIIIVVNRLRATDQIYIDKVREHCKNRNDTKGIIIVHNLYDVESLQDLTNTITIEVEGIFGAKKHEKQFTVGGHMTSTSYYSSKLSDDFELTHFIMAKSGTPAGKLCNMQSLDGIMNMLQAATEQKASFNIISEMIKFMNMRLSQLFARQIPLIDDSSQENVQFAQQDDQNNVRIIQHDSQPYIVLANRKHLQNLEENPYPLDLSKKLVYDDAGYFIKNVCGLWAPRHNLYDYNDSIHLVLELPGFAPGEINFNLMETGCIVEGTREDLCSKRDATVRASEIPTGKFQLEISFEQPIDKRSAKSERRHGFIIITALKKTDDPTPLQV